MAFTEEQFKSEFSEKTEELKRKTRNWSLCFRATEGNTATQLFFEEVINAIEPIPGKGNQ